MVQNGAMVEAYYDYSMVIPTLMFKRVKGKYKAYILR